MERRHFQLVAEALGKTLQTVECDVVETAKEYARNIAHTNPKFKETVFVEAVLKAYQS